jgi:hypothetical protein
MYCKLILTMCSALVAVVVGIMCKDTCYSLNMISRVVQAFKATRIEQN